MARMLSNTVENMISDSSEDNESNTSLYPVINNDQVLRCVKYTCRLDIYISIFYYISFKYIFCHAIVLIQINT